MAIKEVTIYWVPVSDRLPEYYKVVLIAIPYSDCEHVNVGSYDIDNKFKVQTMTGWEPQENFTGPVTHWAYYPIPPE